MPIGALENSVRRALLLFDGDPTGFVTRPISGTIFAVFAIVAVFPIVQAVRHRRKPSEAPGDTHVHHDDRHL